MVLVVESAEKLQSLCERHQKGMREKEVKNERGKNISIMFERGVGCTAGEN